MSKLNFKILLLTLTFTFVCLAVDKWPPAHPCSDYHVSNSHRPEYYLIQDGRADPQCTSDSEVGHSYSGVEL